jgi:uncharacterized membrane protein YfcA
MQIISDPIFYLVAIPAVLLTGISKGGLGGALGGVAVPLMALAIDPRQAAAIMLPVLCLSDLYGLRIYFRKWDVGILKTILPSALIGVALGALTFGAFNEDAIRLLIGAICVAFVLIRLLGSTGGRVAVAPSARKGRILSAVSGFTSFVAHAGAPPLMIYLIPQKLDKTTYIATINFFFLLTNAIKLLPYAWLGQFSGTNLIASLSLAPLILAGVWLGFWMQQRINQTWFYRIAQVCLLLTGLHLIYQGVTRLWPSLFM